MQPGLPLQEHSQLVGKVAQLAMSTPLGKGPPPSAAAAATPAAAALMPPLLPLHMLALPAAEAGADVGAFF